MAFLVALLISAQNHTFITIGWDGASKKQGIGLARRATVKMKRETELIFFPIFE